MCFSPKPLPATVTASVCVWCVCVGGEGGRQVHTAVQVFDVLQNIHGVYATTAAITMPSGGVKRARAVKWE